MLLRPFVVSSLLVGFSGVPAYTAAAVVVSGDLVVWRPVTVVVSGPMSSEGGDPNPFLDVHLKVTWTQGTDRHVIPGFYAADGNPGETGATAGKVWKSYFVPTRPGKWSYRVAFRSGPGVALAEGADTGAPLEGDGATGQIEVAPDPGARGMLRYVRRRYLQDAATGKYFLKGGADSPENFLAYHEFDGTPEKVAAPQRKGEAAPRLHRYEPHVGDWRKGDPTWRGGKGKGIIGALNYLASQGANSVYFLTMNIEGDGKDVWPYTAEDDRYRFDCSKLAQWEVVFRHMDRLGIMLHVVLSETENESLFEVEEGGDFARSRKLYYRELVARLAHHRALVWNLGEENGWDDRERDTSGPSARANTDGQRKSFSAFVRALDPYRHPIVVHTLPGRYDEIYQPLLGVETLDGPSLQIHLGKGIHTETKKWIAASAKAGHAWVVTLDEIGPAGDGVKPDSVDPTHDDVRRYALWGTLMAGGAGCEWYFGYKHPHNDLQCEDFRSRERMWFQTRAALEFFRRELPFWEMQPADELVRGDASYCFAKPGEVYAVYIPLGGTAELELPAGDYSVSWFRPRSGKKVSPADGTAVRGGSLRALGPAPGDLKSDWVALVKRRP